MKLAIVVSGWHFPLHFYMQMANLNIPEGWEVKLFCVSHRTPINDKQFGCDNIRGKLDKILYRKVADVEDIKGLNWNYKLYPNTIGDWGCSNQWLDENDYKEYDMFLFSHDDNLIINHNLLVDIAKMDWQILTNSVGVPPGSLRGSFEFFKKEIMDIMGGKFDLSETKLTRVGQFDTPKNMRSISDWNTTVYPTQRLIKRHNIRVESLSPYYRFSKYCIEGERGLIQNTCGSNTAIEAKAIEEYENILKEFICENQQ